MNALQWFVEIASWLAILGGSFFMITGAVGTYRFPDFWTRMHAVSVSDSAGMLLLVLGMCIQAGFTLITVKLIIIGAFLFITGPTATHAVANAAMVSGFLPKGAEEFRKMLERRSREALKAGKKKRSPIKGLF